MNIFQKAIDVIKNLLKSLENLKTSVIFQKVKSVVGSFFSDTLSKGTTKIKTLIVNVYNNTTGSISAKIEAAAKSITKTLVNGIHIGPLVDFIVGNPYKKPEKSNWEMWGMESNTAINVPVWQLWFTVIYVASSQLISQVAVYVLKLITEMYLVTQYAAEKSPFPIKYASDSLQVLIVYGAQLSCAWIFVYLFLKIVRSIKR